MVMINGEAPMDAEVGSDFDYTDRLFWYWQDGQALLPSEVKTAEIDDMLRADGKARALEGVLTLPIRAAKWSIEPAKGDTGEAAALNDLIDPSEMQLLISQATSAQLYRRAYFEKMFRIADDGEHVTYDRVAWRPPATCELARDAKTGVFDGFWQWAAQGDGQVKHVQIVRRRAWVVIHGRHRNPWAGVSELETAYAIFEVKQKVRWLWYQFLENHSMPKAKAKTGVGGTQNGSSGRTPQQLAAAVAKLKGSGVIGLGPGEDVEPYSTNGVGADQYKAAVDFLNNEMADSLLASFLNLAGATRGSYALSKDQTDFFLQAREGVARELEASIRGSRHIPGLLDDLTRYNFGTKGVTPLFKFAPLSILDAEAAVTLLQQIAQSPRGQGSLPQEFIDLLIAQVASYLGMDAGKIAVAIKKAQEQAPPTQIGQLGAAVDVAKGLVQRAQQPAAGPAAGAAAPAAGGAAAR